MASDVLMPEALKQWMSHWPGHSEWRDKCALNQYTYTVFCMRMWTVIVSIIFVFRAFQKGSHGTSLRLEVCIRGCKPKKKKSCARWFFFFFSFAYEDMNLMGHTKPIMCFNTRLSAFIQASSVTAWYHGVKSEAGASADVVWSVQHENKH